MRRATLLATFCALLAVGCGKSASVPTPRAASGADIALAADVTTVKATVPRNATLEALLRAQDVSADVVNLVIDSARTVFDPRRLMPEHAYEIVRSLDGHLRNFQYQIDTDRLLRIVRHVQAGETVYAASIVELPKDRVEAVAAGAIDENNPSLFEAMDAAGAGPDLAVELAAIFSGEIDFNTDLQRGDTFQLDYEKDVRDGQLLGYGPIAAASFENAGRHLVAIRFTPDGGEPGYYDAQGRSLKRFFLRSPLKFEPTPRITSGFSRSRFHPVLHRYRAHLGVDYHAPMGAPVQAVASGVVLSAGWSGGSGRMVHLRHPNGYETYYLHLSSISSGVRRGAHVSQGEVIGRVGQSGLATGPHLDFRIRRHGEFLNPVTVRKSLPPGLPIEPSDRPAFEAVLAREIARLHGPGAVPGAKLAAAATGDGTTKTPASRP
jgi:murein DD-endopeptidase MepM/ murein hydrolase activator NlpD